jgi:hypothetical protein
VCEFEAPFGVDDARAAEAVDATALIPDATALMSDATALVPDTIFEAAVPCVRTTINSRKNKAENVGQNMYTHQK